MYIHENTMNDAFWNKSRGSFLSAGFAMISARLIPMYLATRVLNLGIDSCANLSHTHCPCHNTRRTCWKSSFMRCSNHERMRYGKAPCRSTKPISLRMNVSTSLVLPSTATATNYGIQWIKPKEKNTAFDRGCFFDDLPLSAGLVAYPACSLAGE